nr:hypothetical protein [Thermoleophilaceae bacterium]
MNEAARIEQAYAARDAGPGIYSASDPAVRLHLAELERLCDEHGLMVIE